MFTTSLALLPGYGNTAATRAPRFARLRSAFAGIFEAIRRDKAGAAAVAFGLSMLSLSLLALAAAITHVVWCLKTGSFLFLVAGLIPFVSVVHGVMIWLGNA